MDLACADRSVPLPGYPLVDHRHGAGMRFHHVGLLFPSHDDAERIARERFGERSIQWQRVPAFSCDCAFLVRHVLIELVVPDAESRLAKYRDTSPTALHHLAFWLQPNETPPEPGALLFPIWALGANGMRVNFETPRDG